jgi:hypothetical protein
MVAAAFCLTACALAATEPAWPRIGRLAPRPASAIRGSTWSVGGETLDRDFAVYEHYRAWLGPLGAKAVRLQAGCRPRPRRWRRGTPGCARWCGATATSPPVRATS